MHLSMMAHDNALEGAHTASMPLEIVEYRPAWPLEFVAFGAELRDALGDLALSIHHIGSTAVPGLAAKDILDVQISVADLNDPRLRPALEGLGLTWREAISTDHTPPGQTLNPAQLEKRMAVALAPLRRAHIHLRQIGRFNQRYPLLCRDYLRSHPGAMHAYAEIKRQLARKFPEDVESYYDIKDPVFDLLMAGAEDWAQETGWQPGLFDA